MKCSQQILPKSKNVLRSRRTPNPHYLQKMSSEPGELVVGRDLLQIQVCSCPANAFLLLRSIHLSPSPPEVVAYAIKHLCIVNPTRAISILKLIRKNCAGTHLEHSHCSPALLWNLLEVQTVQSKEETGSSLGWVKEGTTISNKSTLCSSENKGGRWKVD